MVRETIEIQAGILDKNKRKEGADQTQKKPVASNESRLHSNIVVLAGDIRVLRGAASGLNDPKLSDCGARRAGCGKVVGAGWAKAAGWSAAASVTRGAVRCSAWLN